MSGIIKFIKSVCVQTAVYWQPGQADGFGQIVFPSPVEVDVRWDDVAEVISDGKGKEIVSKAQIMTPTMLKEQGYLFLGELSDLNSEQVENPVLVNKAYEIKRVDKAPLFRSTDEFVITVYL